MPLTLSPIIVHFGMLDGSAGVAVSDDAFLGVSDERNVVRLYATDAKTSARDVLRLDDDEQQGWFVREKKDKELKPGEPLFKEADIEGAAQVFDADGKGGSVIYWITSFGAEKNDGEVKKHKERRLFFATRLHISGGKVSLTPEGVVRKDLLDAMIAAAKPHGIDLETASKQDAKAAPDPKANPPTWGGLNIESLCASADGRTLYVGFRNPVPEGKAILLPLENAAAIVNEKAVSPKFGKPIRLNMGGLGFRDMVWCPQFSGYLIIGGHYDEHLGDEDARKPRLFLWKDTAGTALDTFDVPEFAKLNPEALVLFPTSATQPVERVLILSDDGGFKADGKNKQKDLVKADPLSLAKCSFRAAWLEGSPRGNGASGPPDLAAASSDDQP